MLNKDRYCLESILDAIDRINEYTSEFNSADEFYKDYRNFDATLMNFVIIGEMVDKLSSAIKSEDYQIEWLKIKDFRNIVAHDYFGIDAEEVWQIIINDIPDLEVRISKMLDDSLG